MRIRIVSFGCSANMAEGEMMAGLLKKAGYDIVEDGEDIFIVNICSVKARSLNKGLREIRKASSKVIAAGCIPSGAEERIWKLKDDASIINTHNLKRIVGVVERTANGEVVTCLGKEAVIKTCIPRVRENKIVAIIPISSGCLGSCAYCSVKLIKGGLVSFPQEKVILEAENAISEGCRELWVTAQDVGAYGKDLDTDIVALLNQLLKIEGNFKIRLGMANPEHIKPLVEKLIQILKDDKMFRFIHIPVQSGNNRILKLMNRRYTVEDYKDIVNTLKKEIPDITISTDIIVGFPTETEEEYEDSLNLVKQTKPNVLNISRYYAQPGTEGKGMKQLNTKEVKGRSAELSKIFSATALNNNRAWNGWEGNIMIDEKGKDRTWLGRNQSYKPIAVKGDFKIGQLVKVKVKKATKHCLLASAVP